MPAKSSKRAADILRLLYRQRESEEVAAGRDGPGMKKRIAKELGVEQSHMSKLLKYPERGIEMETVAAVSDATSIPINVLTDVKLPFDSCLEYVRPGEGKAHETTPSRIADPKSRPSEVKFGLASLEAMQDRIKAIVSELGLDEAGVHYVIARLRAMAMSGKLDDKWDALTKAAEVGKEYEMQATTGAGHSNPGRSSSGVFASVSDAKLRRR